MAGEGHSTAEGGGLAVGREPRQGTGCGWTCRLFSRATGLALAVADDVR